VSVLRLDKVMEMSYNRNIGQQEKAPAGPVSPEARTTKGSFMADTIVPRERLLHAIYIPPHTYEDGTHDEQAIVTALFEEPNVSGSIGYAIREYSLKRGEMFYRFPKEGGHWSRAVIKQEWYRETETELPLAVFEAER
jgi:hypothetical protein